MKPFLDAATMNHRPATALPWRASPARPAEVQQVSGVYTIGLMGMDGAANATYIAHAANAYPKLVEMLRNIASNEWDAGGATSTGKSIRTLLREIGE